MEYNYLDHEFMRNEELNFGNYKCVKCNCVILYRSSKNKYWYGRNELGKGNWQELNLTCNEVIIKNIIE